MHLHEETQEKSEGREGEVSSYLTLPQFVIAVAGLHDSMSPEGDGRGIQSKRGKMTCHDKEEGDKLSGG